VTAGIVVIFLGYTVASYGVVLARGYDITFKEWIDPLNPYSWPKGQIPKVPPGQVFPGGASDRPAPGHAAGRGGKIAGGAMG
jgi:hypothetical protein